MFKVQKLTQPKKISGTKLTRGEVFNGNGIQIRNFNPFPVFVDTYERKSRAKPKVAKKKEAAK